MHFFRMQFGGRLNKDILFYQHKDSHYNDKTVLSL